MPKMPSLRLAIIALCAIATMSNLMPVNAQNSPPTTGPTNPNPLLPPAAGEKTIVINPTMEQCRTGWNAASQWTKDQFDKFCTDFNRSK